MYSFYFLIPSVGHNDHNYNCVLGQGNVSGAVLKVQQALNKCYGAGIAEDQNFGPQTESALRGAQNKEQVAADGVYGPATAARLHWPAYSSTDNKFLDTCASVSFLFA
ncbi:MAG TPA: peptidoglycan-binding domain-containing protein [Candidatus Limnocylindria bacterium]|nr:peptidoglycan-binding domain-containing protein [Candidatus Limnocylindria bacterium]